MKILFNIILSCFFIVTCSARAVGKNYSKFGGNIYKQLSQNDIPLLTRRRQPAYGHL